MQFRIDPDNGLAIWEQIVRQIKYAVAEGVLVPGEMIPSVRDLARELMVNPNTVQRAMQQLQADEVLEPLRGRGMAVCTGARKQCLADRQSLLRQRLEATVDEALQSGLAAERVREMFERALETALRRKGGGE